MHVQVVPKYNLLVLFNWKLKINYMAFGKIGVLFSVLFRWWLGGMNY